MRTQSIEELNVELIQAAKSGDIESLEKAIKGGADVNTAVNPPSAQERRQLVPFYIGLSQGKTALMIVAKNGYKECVRLLIDAGADVNRTTSTEEARTALGLAEDMGQKECAKLLIDAGANKSDMEYFNVLNPGNGCRYDIPMLSDEDPEYFSQYVNFMKIKESQPQTFERIMNWD